MGFVASIPFLSNLTEESVERAIRIFKDGMQARAAPELYDASWPELYKAVDATNRAMRDSPTAARTLQLVKRAWPLVCAMDAHAKMDEVHAVIQRRFLMVTHHHLYRWVEQCMDVTLNGAWKASWFSKLMSATRSAIESGREGDTFQFCSDDYLPSLEPARTLTWAHKGRVRGVTGRDTTLNACSEVIFHWLDVPTDAKHSCQNAFLSSIFSLPNAAEVILLDGVWETYNRPGLMGSIYCRDDLPNLMEITRFREALVVHSVVGSSQSGSAGELFKELNEVYREYTDPIAQPVERPEEPSASTAATPPHALQVPQWPSTSTSVTFTPEAPASPLSNNADVTSYCDWLAELEEGLSSVPSKPTVFQEHMFKDMDANCPFREKAPSRVKITSPEGPFTRGRIRTRAGVFSALVFRGILFKTRALLEKGHSGYFANFEEWEEFEASCQAELEADPEYLCNPCPHGAQRWRSAGHAKAYWLASEIVHRKIEEGASFEDLMGFVARGKLKGKKCCPAFGPLLAYLFCVDLCIAGSLAAPSAEELGKIVCDLSKGARGGLAKLSLVPDKPAKRMMGVQKSAEEEVVSEAFAEIYDFLQTSDRMARTRERVGISIFDVEHSLCKLSRDNGRLGFLG